MSDDRGDLRATFDIEVYDSTTQTYRYTVRGLYDVLHTDDIDAAMDFIRESAEQS